MGRGRAGSGYGRGMQRYRSRGRDRQQKRQSRRSARRARRSQSQLDLFVSDPRTPRPSRGPGAGAEAASNWHEAIGRIPILLLFLAVIGRLFVVSPLLAVLGLAVLVPAIRGVRQLTGGLPASAEALAEELPAEGAPAEDAPAEVPPRPPPLRPGEFEVIGEDVPADTRCAYCNDGLAPAEGPRDPTVLCRSCGTPHHESCWAEAGVCATYACGGTEPGPS